MSPECVGNFRRFSMHPMFALWMWAFMTPYLTQKMILGAW
jgi:hypothetical protein